MFLYRSLTIGLLGAVIVLLAQRPAAAIRHPAREVPAVAVPAVPALAVVDVAPELAPDEIARLVTLAPGERITAIDDDPVTNPIDAALALVMHCARPRHAFVDVALAGGAAGERRVLLLLH